MLCKEREREREIGVWLFLHAYNMQGCMIHINHYMHCTCNCSFCAELREEDSADKPNEYIETCIGRSEPLAKVSDN